jgi:hypothetical protein
MYFQATSKVIECLNGVREGLAVLLPKLREANERCAHSSGPLANLDKLNLQQRQELASAM